MWSYMFLHGEVYPFLGQVGGLRDVLSDDDTLCVRILCYVQINKVREVCDDIFAVPTTAWIESVAQ